MSQQTELITHKNYSLADMGDNPTVNLATGRLRFAFDDLSIGHGTFAIGISHIYSSKYCNMTGDQPYGSGWKLNLMQFLRTDGNNTYKYCDANGEIHRFVNFYNTSPHQGRFYDESNAKVVLNCENDVKYIEDGVGNKLYFDTNGYLSKSVSCHGVTKIFEYSGTRLTKVYDARSCVNGFAKKRIELTYDANDKLTAITTYDSANKKQKQLIYKYSGDNLVAVDKAAYYADPSKIITKQLYKFDYSGSQLKTVVDCQSQSAMQFDYDGSSRVSAVRHGYMSNANVLSLSNNARLGAVNCGMFGAEFVEKTKQTVDYYDCSAKVINSNNVCIVYFYDRDYRIISSFEEKLGALKTLTRQNAKRSGKMDGALQQINGYGSKLISNGQLIISNFKGFTLSDIQANTELNRYEYAMWIKHYADYPRIRMDVSYLVAGDSSTKSNNYTVWLNARAYGAWQRVAVPIELPNNKTGEIKDKLIRLWLKFSYAGSVIADDIYINEIGFSPAPHVETYVGTGTNRLAVSQAQALSINGSIYLADDEQQITYLTDDDIAATCTYLFKGDTDSEIVCNNGTKRISTTGRTIQIGNGKGNWQTLSLPTPYYTQTLFPANGSSSTVEYRYYSDEIDVIANYTDNGATSTATKRLNYNGDLIEETDEYGVKTVYEYNTDGSVASVTLRDSMGANVTKTEYKYDDEGRVTEVRDGIGGQIINYTDDIATETVETLRSTNGQYLHTQHSVQNAVGIFKDKTLSVTEYADSKPELSHALSYQDGSVRTVTDGIVKYGMQIRRGGDEILYTQFNDANNEITVQADSVQRVSTGQKQTAAYYNDGTASETSSVETSLNLYDKVTSVTLKQSGLLDKTVTYTYGDVAESLYAAPLTEVKEGSQTKITYSYDEGGNLTGWSGPVGSVNSAVQQIGENVTKYTLGNQKWVSSTEYDTAKVSAPRLTAVKHYCDSSVGYDEFFPATKYDTAYSYDNAGRLQQKTTSDQGRYDYTYLPNTTDTVKKLEYKNYDGNNPDLYQYTVRYCKQKTYTGRDVTNVSSVASCAKQYNALQSADIKVGGQTSYTYDKQHRITYVTEREERNDGYIMRTRSITYAKNGRLDNIYKYAKYYKADGTREVLEESTDDYGYSRSGLTSVGSARFSYDNYGNRISRTDDGVTTTYQYNYGDKLVKVNNNVSYGYNVDGVREYKTVNGLTTGYFLDGDKILGEVRPNETVRYLYDANGLQGFITTTGSYKYVTDDEGSVMMILDITGKNVLAFYKYDIFGNCTVYDGWGEVDTNASSIGNKNPFRWKGFYYDAETGLYYANCNYYDPQTGTYLDATSIADIMSNAPQPTSLDRNSILCNNTFELAGNPYTVATTTELTPDPSYDGSKRPWWYWVIGGVLAAATFLIAVVVTGGWIMPLLSTLVGAVVGAGYGAVTALYNGQDVKSGALLGMFSGIIMGNTALAGSKLFMAKSTITLVKIISKSSGLGVALAGGAIAGAYNERWTQILNYGRVTDEQKFKRASLEYGLVNVFSMGSGILTDGIEGFEAVCGVYIFDLFASTITLAIDVIRGLNLLR